MCRNSSVDATFTNSGTVPVGNSPLVAIYGKLIGNQVAGQQAIIDNLNVTPEPAMIGLLLLGLPFLRRRR